MKYLIFLFAIVLTYSCSTVHAPKTNSLSKKVSAKEFQQEMNETKVYQLIDVRTPEEFEEGHLKKAFLINFKDADFKEKISQLDKKKPIFIYCRSGGRSAKAHQLLKELGFQYIFELEGGIQAWKEAKLPVDSL